MAANALAPYDTRTAAVQEKSDLSPCFPRGRILTTCAISVLRIYLIYKFYVFSKINSACLGFKHRTDLCFYDPWSCGDQWSNTARLLCNAISKILTKTLDSTPSQGSYGVHNSPSQKSYAMLHHVSSWSVLYRSGISHGHTILMAYFDARLQWLQCISNAVTAVLQ